ncbi:Os01g0106700 [Oryza sativa Japonica Group]|uniref:non-specific serine/threonine protein kinase n=1 Tax=Oryza sativa subsp. japonica TaxID=39947 RepID=A0A0P0UX66_ORYSJ|nr:hypothetical protein EE612_004378 [Oryza sativa]BAS69975.1 Os01g0106700 [Oryza sativa Japonica Group]
MATSRDADEIIEKLSSDRARTRDEGVKLLGTWLQGDRAFSFCRLLARNTANLKPAHLPASATWPFLIMALTKCVIADISGKKRSPKSAAARMLRLAVQCAQDFRLSGRSLLLISVAKKLFSHIWEVVKDAPSFLIEYSIILRQLLTVKEYRYQMKPRTYSSFVVLYMKKVATGFDEKISNQASSKEESFRCTLTLHVLLENPPGDYPDIMREEDGPNLGCKSVDIHNAVQDFMFHSWPVTHDRALKSLFITYAKVQLELARAIPEILEKLLDVIIKELDQNFNTGAGLVWCEAPRDEKAGSLRCFQEELMDLSATALYLAYKCTPRTSHNKKKLKTEHVMTAIMDSLLRGSLVWSGSICCLIHKYGYRVDKSLLINWFKATCKGLKRVLKEFSALLMSSARDAPPFWLTNDEVDSVLRLLGEMIMRGDVSNSIFIRKNLLRSTFELVHSKDKCWSHEEELGYSVETLSEINLESPTKAMSEKCSRAHLPRHIQQPLLLELLEFTKGFMSSNKQFEKVDLPNLVYACSLVCNLIHCSLLSRVFEEKSSFLQVMLDYVTNAIKHIVSVVMKEHAELSHGLTNLGSVFDTTGSALSSFKSFMHSPLFSLWRVNNKTSSVLGVTELLDELLEAISELFAQFSSLMNNFDGDNPSKMLPVPFVSLSEDLHPDNRSSFVDMDLDMTGSGEVDPVTAGGSGSMGISPRPLECKLELVCIISTFFSVVPLHTWEVLYNLADKEVNIKVGQAILLELCTNISASSSSLSSVNQDVFLDLLNKATEISFTDWFFRIRLINCISNFIYLFPDVAQDMIGHLLSMLHDTDYRVRLYLARKIVVLFQIWEGHSELFHDVCSSIGVKMVQFSNENPVRAREVLAIGPQPVPIIETALITLAHLSLQSEDIEVECVFMISAVAAIEPSQRELTYALFDSVSKRLNYASRSKYLDQLIGPILFRWVACEVSLVSLVEVKEMFGFKSDEPKNFIEHCCSWLLSFLILRGETADLNWLSKILSQPLSAVIKGYFVPIFGLCIAARYGSGPEKDLAETVLCESLLQLGEISEPERDDLIKKHMVSIVGFLLSVSSSSRQPEIPHFSKEAVAHSVKTVVDGFMDAMDGNLAETVVIDKINIFRSDRVFKFLLAIHQQIADASHPRHIRHRLCAIEVLIDDLEPLPSFDCLKDIQVFHASLSGSYDSRDQFLKAGISDVHQVIFHVPNLTEKYPIQPHISKEDKLPSDYGISDDILVGLLKLLKACLSDESAEIIDVTSRTLRGVLSTARGLNALHCLDSLDRSLLMVHSRGINAQVVEQTLLGMEKVSGEKARGCPSNTLKDGRSVRSKSRSPTTTPSSSWKKVYWLSVDYLVAARAANRCSCDFATLMYVELWCEEKFNMLALGPPDFSHEESLPPHIDLLVASFTRINELDSIYGITLANEITSQIIRYEHEGDWSSALEYHDLLVRSTRKENHGSLAGTALTGPSDVPSKAEEKMLNWQMHKGLMRSLQKTGCSHVLDVYCQGLSNQKSCLQQDSEFIDMQYEAAWRAGNWDFSFFIPYSSQPSTHSQSYCLFNGNLHSCLRALQNGDSEEFHVKLSNSKMDLVLALSNASKESTKYIHSTVIKLQMLDHLTMAWDLRWKFCLNQTSKSYVGNKDFSPVPTVPTRMQLELLNKEWTFILCQTERNLDLLEPFLAFRSAVLKILGSEEHLREHLFQSASALRKGARFSLAAAALYELKELRYHMDHQAMPNSYFLFKLEEAKLLRAQGQHDMAINLGKYILKNHPDKKNVSDVYRLVGKWLAETRSSNSRTIIDDYLRHSVDFTELHKCPDKKYKSRQCRTYFHLAHYTDGLFKSYEERLSSNEWQAALRLRKYKSKELDTLMKRLKSSSKSEKTDYSVKIQELQKQLALDEEEAGKIQDDRDKFLNLALQGYQRSLVVGGKYDLQVVFRLVSLWFSLFSREQVVKAMMKTTKEVQSYKFIPLVYQIASRLGSSKDAQGSTNFQNALASLLKKMAIDHPYHTIFQLLALANGDRVKDKQRSRSSFIVDMDKKLAAENLLKDLSSSHGALIRQMKQMVEIYIKLAELETKKEDTNKRIPLPREIRSICQLELVPVVTASIPVDPNCQYEEGSFPHFNGLADSIMVMNGINAPKVIECIGSDGNKYRQLAKSGNDDLRQDAVVPFTPSAGVVEWVNGTVPLAEYLVGSTRSGGAHGRYGTGDWTYHQCRETMTNEKDKRRAFVKVCNNFRPVMHHFFLERFLQPADWFQSRLAYTRSVAASSMVGYIVGLGDRHSQNILIDQETAEVVHIDLGVAFEQGLMLKTPERVPFRLTRDMIDGMGVTGVEGVFRRCCEKTLSVMRANKEALVTIIEVFVHDPLYKWALSPLKALQRQKESEDIDSCLDDSQEACEGNKDAARAILRVKQKLDGYEDGEMRSVQGQVQQLIQDAVDADRLCQMFPGWGAWL